MITIILYLAASLINSDIYWIGEFSGWSETDRGLIAMMTIFFVSMDVMFSIAIRSLIREDV